MNPRERLRTVTVSDQRVREVEPRPGTEISNLNAGRDINVHVGSSRPFNYRKLLVISSVILGCALAVLSSLWEPRMQFDEAKWVINSQEEFSLIRERADGWVAKHTRSADISRRHVEEVFVYWDTTTGSLFHSDVSLVTRIVEHRSPNFRWEIGTLGAAGKQPARTRVWSLKQYPEMPLVGDVSSEDDMLTALAFQAKAARPSDLDAKLAPYQVSSQDVRPVLRLKIVRDISDIPLLFPDSNSSTWQLEYTSVRARDVRVETKSSGEAIWHEIELSRNDKQPLDRFTEYSSSFEKEVQLTPYRMRIGQFTKYQRAATLLQLQWSSE